MSARVPLRHSLLIRLLAASVVIAACAIAATAWLTARGATRALQREQVAAAGQQTSIYTELVAYAATHPTWDDVGPLLATLGTRTGLEIRLTTSDGRLLGGSPRAVTAYMVVDPLHVDPGVVPAHFEYIDDRAVGPYRLTADERRLEQATSEKVVTCFNEKGYTARATGLPSGRIAVSSGAPAAVRDSCGLRDFATYVYRSEQAALVELSRLMRSCLDQNELQGKVINPVTWRYFPAESGIDAERAVGCTATGRRIQLERYVAPPAQLFVNAAPASTVPVGGFRLSGPNITRTAGAALLVLTVTVLVTALVGARLVRPLRALTAAAQHPAGHQPGMPVRGRDEIGALTTALNQMSERRERAEAQRREMVSDIAHELRTPLSNIRTWLEAAEDGLAPPVTDAELTSLLLTEAMQLQHIVADLQDLADADAGSLRLDRRRVHVGELIRQAVTAHHGSAEAAGLDLRFGGAGDADVDADPVRIAQVLTNLITNAIRYTSAGGTVTVEARTEGDDVVLTVADTGHGISEHDLPYVFDRFWRADPSRNRNTGGSGLGLAIVRDLVTAHGGTITVSSIVGHGSTFTVRLPTV
ncbi:ATP-binding protein [Actinoplanes sp. NPDC049265]|uniref:HAMP domain-containing sensor histidine kinase n=1 Tax=Actinoplanes sp. NPDC049265 TaxID=3363902 RepID=UPI00371D1D72